ncbi:dnaJ homolog subfamily C member 25 homolog [Tetranychus urticae]|uniref:J domain-containing protein n=1 Tax=Tetranychus urticae TaxID=32264 RepID=T1K874_TETUR|nr:dnaJ homolog subfamily C member 25 homolog [Tetranychus urticae]XP_015784581.1 dnaJ homolog subfamily C member 25 homolog [Tetranychus urticae]
MDIKVTLVLVIFNLGFAYGFFEGIYCGVDNCYDVLNVTRESTKEEITKAYRKLARKHHPDVHKTAEAKAEASEKFTKLAAAYEILRDDEQRKDYNYMLDNPDEVYRHYYHYYRRRYAPKVDVRIVIVITITVISGIQYWACLSKYNEAIDYFLTIPKYRIKATEIAKDEGLLDHSAANRKKNRFKSKDEIRQEEERVLRKIIEEKMDIKGAYAKPKITDVLWIQLFLLPITIFNWIYFQIRWIYKFSICKEEYGDEEFEYLIRKNMSLSKSQYDALDADEKLEYLELELWDKDKFKTWKQEKDDEMRAKLAESGVAKRYRRWKKKGGPGQITFLDD